VPPPPPSQRATMEKVSEGLTQWARLCSQVAQCTSSVKVARLAALA
jgi:hypothetical protein